MGVAGLPASHDCSKPDNDIDRNTMYIGQIMSKHNYGIIHVQEDFCHHQTLYKYDDHPFRTEISGDVLKSLGLNTLSRFDWVDFAKIPWNPCGTGTKKDLDCTVKKGFTFMRLRIDEGVYIDMINLHADAGDKYYDQIGRRKNIQQVADYITANSTGNAVIVFGDTNSHYSQSGDNIRLFTTQNKLADAWVRAIGGNEPAPGSGASICNCEKTEKVFYRGSRVINLEPIGFYYDTSMFQSPAGARLTTSTPTRVEFEYTLDKTLRQSDLYGGPFGTWFNDLASIPSSPKLSSITFRGANRLDGVTFTLTSGETFKHGGTGGKAHTLKLEQGEYITSVKLCWGQRNGHTRNFYAQATTNKANTVEAGKLTNDCETTVAPLGFGVVSAYGQGGDEMDQLGFIFAQQ
ncbi:unnamed protein product [Rhizoctonia solani]|uniref:Jacalin-type lectin domain-containing protein n=1 Tax=Rhizoctonia solani TaxID=456999 RepID=A0A8H3GFR7_9AGAM|nr:unnamed protein product [Rhizoctonia solani]